MPPKQTKKTTNATISTDDNALNVSKKEWADNVSEIISLREKLTTLEKRNEEIVNKIWEIINKNPTEQVVIEATKVEDEKKPIKSKTEEPESKPKKAAPKSKAKVKEEVVEDSDVEIEGPAPVVAPKKAAVKKDTKAKETKETKETKKPTAAATKGKISAPSKGTPKPKQVDSDDEKPKPIMNDSSSDTEVDSLSSVSDESDASGGDND